MPTITCSNQEVNLVPVSKKITLDACPGCGGGVERRKAWDKDLKKMVNDPFLYCKNPEKCSGVHGKRLKKWVKKRNILHLGDSNLDILITSGAVKQIPDFYDLTVQSMLAAGMSEGMAKKIHKQINDSRTCPLAEFIGSLSLDMLGRSEAKNLVEYGVDSLKKWSQLSVNNIEALPGYKKTKATRIWRALKDDWKLVQEVAACLTITSVETKAKSGKLDGLSFCLTGSMNQPRKQLEQMVVDAGGQIHSVSKSLSYLVIADPRSTSSKVKKARELGINIISETKFLGMLK